MRAWIVLGLAIGTGCRKESGSGAARVERGSGAAPAAVLAPAPAGDAGAGAGDAGAGAADAGTADAGADGTAGGPWPASVEVATITTEKQLSRTLALDLALPRFRTKPPALGVELNARFARYTKVDTPRSSVGSYYVHCAHALASRFAVIEECGEMRNWVTAEEARAGTGGAPAGPEPQITAVWLQPGMPRIELGELAPGINAGAEIARAVKRAPPDCNLDRCEYKPASFSIDAGGIVFRPVAYCSIGCEEEHLPRIPLDALKPTQPRAMQLVDWIRKRVAADESLVEATFEP